MNKNEKTNVNLNFNRRQIMDIAYTYSLDKLERIITGKLLEESDEFGNFVFAGFDHAFPHELQLFFVPGFTITSLESSRTGEYRKPILAEYFKLQQERAKSEPTTKRQSAKLIKIDSREEKLNKKLFKAIMKNEEYPESETLKRYISDELWDKGLKSTSEDDGTIKIDIPLSITGAGASDHKEWAAFIRTVFVSTHKGKWYLGENAENISLQYGSLDELDLLSNYYDIKHGINIRNIPMADFDPRNRNLALMELNLTPKRIERDKVKEAIECTLTSVKRLEEMWG